VRELALPTQPSALECCAFIRTWIGGFVAGCCAFFGNVLVLYGPLKLEARSMMSITSDKILIVLAYS
jgi:hypothetical protein